MTAVDPFPRYRAPQTNRQILCVPPWADVRGQLTTPPTTSTVNSVTNAVEIFGVPLPTLAREARQEFLTQAHRYTNSYTNAGSYTHAGEQANVDEPLVITGHQPEFVHPGVWLKNFAAAKLAREVGGTAVSLIIDSDLCRSPSIRVPTGTIEQPHVVNVPFDLALHEMPFEAREIADRSSWNSFGKRVTKTIGPLIPNPLLAEWWPEVLGQTAQTPNLGLAIAQVRHRLERRWGCRNLEIPQSQVCETVSFQKFMLHLLHNAARLRNDYNSSLAEYRQVHRLRSAAQPLPDLHKVEGWVETPFWIWTIANPTRHALFVRQGVAGLELTNRQDWQTTLPPGAAGLARLVELQQAGLKLRSRALITTLFARLLLADAFIHGIGGAKYDQVTNLLSQRFFDVKLPQLTALSGTLRLPIEHPPASPTRLSEFQQTLRELQYHPETHINELALNPSDQAEIKCWVQTKKEWVQKPKTPENATHRHAQIITANCALHHWLAPHRKQILQEHSATLAQLRVNTVLESREYSFCLFPPQVLGNFLLDFSRQIP